MNRVSTGIQHFYYSNEIDFMLFRYIAKQLFSTLYMIKNTSHTSWLILVFCFLSFASFSQMTKIKGKITDALTGEAIMFANVVFKATNVGTLSDENGNYFIETRNAGDTLLFTILGYYPQKVKVKKGIFQEINIKLTPTNTLLDEVVVVPGENPANILFRKIIKNKKFNNIDKLESYECEVYNKMEFDISNIDSTFREKAVLKPFKVIFDYIDTSAINGKSYLPAFLSETVSDFYMRKNPKLEREQIKASKMTGLKNESITQFAGDMYLKTNIYDNYIDIFRKQFISPVSNMGLLYYKYLIIDTAKFQNRTCYHVTFRPRSRQEPTFTGDFWVQDSSFGIVKYQMRINEKANINFINDLVQSNEFELQNDSVWVLKKEELFIDFQINKKARGLFGKKTTTYNNYVVNKPRNDEFYRNLGMERIQVLDSAEDKTNAYWKAARGNNLTEKEAATYKLMDTIQKIPLFHSYLTLVKMFYTGYKEMKYVKFGPYYSTFTFNKIEGYRFKIGARTKKSVSEKFMFDSYLAFGSTDIAWKYGAGVTYVFKKMPRHNIHLGYKHDLVQLGQSENAFGDHGFLNSFLRRNPDDKLTWITEYSCTYMKEWFTGFSNTVAVKQRTILPSKIIPFELYKGTNAKYSIPDIKTLELRLNTHFAWNERFIYGDFDRVSVGTRYPVINLNVSLGVMQKMLGNYEYLKCNASINHFVPIGPFGRFNYSLSAGKIFGTLPYPLLELHSGNETYAFDESTFNLMNYYEFVSDKYVALALTHHFDGFFFNKIPLFRRMKLREVVQARGVMGSLSNANKNYSVMPTTLGDLSRGPYMEGGVGIENIFKVMRVDALWRLNYLDHPNISPFGIRVMFVLVF